MARSVWSASALQPSSAVESASSPLRASATSGSPACLKASTVATLRLMKRASSANSEREAVVKSLQRVPTPRITSASRAIALAAVVPVAPIAPSDCGWS